MPPSNRNRTARQRHPSANPGEKAAVSPTGVPVYTAHEPAQGIERIGDILRKRRQQRGDDLQQIADYLCIRKSFLVALENSEYDQLPADAYVIGFLRSYASYLGFDGGDAINRYRGEMSGRRRKPSLVLPTPIVEGRTPSAFIMVGAAVVAVLIYILWYGLSSGDRSIANTAPPLPAAVASTAPAQPAAGPAQPVPTSIPGGIALSSPPPGESVSATPATANPQAVFASTNKAQGLAIPVSATLPIAPKPEAAAPAAEAEAVAPAAPSHLAIRAEKESWVVIADSKGHTVLDKVMKAGDTFPIPAGEGLKLTTGNSGGIVIVLDGKDLPKLSRDSSILHDIPLDIEKLKSGKAKALAKE